MRNGKSCRRRNCLRPGGRAGRLSGSPPRRRRSVWRTRSVTPSPWCGPGVPTSARCTARRRRRKQVEAQDRFRPASRIGRRISSGSRRPTREQVPETVERAVGGVDRLIEREIRHVRPEDIRLQPPPRQAAFEIGQRRPSLRSNPTSWRPRARPVPPLFQAARAAGRVRAGEQARPAQYLPQAASMKSASSLVSERNAMS